MHNKHIQTFLHYWYVSKKYKVSVLKILMVINYRTVMEEQNYRCTSQIHKHVLWLKRADKKKGYKKTT